MVTDDVRRLRTLVKLPPKAASKSRRTSPLYRGAKISNHRFLRVLDHFVRDSTTSETAKATGLSVNSVHAVYRKLRVFFYDVHLFRDFYQGQDPVTFESGDPEAELALLNFHLGRVGQKRGLRSPITEPSYHFAESCWRYDFFRMMRERPSDAVYAMMRSHLLELIRLCGPVGSVPVNREAGALAVMRQIDQRIEWFKRSAPGFRSSEMRAALDDAGSVTALVVPPLS